MTNLIQTLEIPKKMKWEMEIDEIPEGFDVTLYNDETDNQIVVDHCDFAIWLNWNGYFEWRNDHLNLGGHYTTEGKMSYEEWLDTTDDLSSALMRFITDTKKI